MERCLRMDQADSEMDPQGREQVRKPRVIRSRNAAGHAPKDSYDASFGDSFPAVNQANPGRVPVRNSQERSPYARRTAQGSSRPDDRRNARTQGRGGQDHWGGDDPEYPKRKNSHPFLYATVIMVCTLLLISLGLFIAPQLTGVLWKDMPNYGFINGQLLEWNQSRMDTYKSSRSALTGDIIYPGVYIDNISVGSMTLNQAKAALQSQSEQLGGSFSLTVKIGNRSFDINSQMVPLSRNIDQVLEKAYALGRQNTTGILKTNVTPFQQRLSAVANLKSNAVSFSSEMAYDKAAVRTLTDAMASYVNVDAVNAAVKTFDFNARTFTFTDESAGLYVDADDLYRQVIAKLDAREYGQTVTIEPTVLTPKVTKVELMNSFKLVSSYTTTTTSNSNRNTNIDLSSKAINGRTVMPGETFSFNEATGQRTEAKGYKEAVAISGGQTVPDIGGGVCQTSSTLFNAVARANLEIVERSPHAWPSTYVPKGMDATVNWPDLDFKFKNNKDTPIFIISYYSNRKVTAEIYGMSLGTGVSIDLVSTVTKTLSPPSDVKYVQNPDLPAGTSKQTIDARTGYVVDTYKVWYRDGKETKREKLFTSTYKAYQRTVEYN